MPSQSRAEHWRIAGLTISFGRVPQLMGIVNVTPDSFSDGGRYFELQSAVEHGLRLVEQGADILDIGGESTRPYAEPVSAEEELRRVIPVISQLAERTTVPLSIDTSKAIVAREAVQAGAAIINDVTALTGDPEMSAVVTECSAGLCLMHMQGTPQTMQKDPHYEDVRAEVWEFLLGRAQAVEALGVARQRIALDPGIGFGKRLSHNLTILREIGSLVDTGYPVLVGHSRKRFLRECVGEHAAALLHGTIAVALAMAQRGVQILRVHEVQPVREALRAFEAVGSLDTNH